MQLTVAVIGAVAVMLAAISGPLVSYFFGGDTANREVPATLAPNSVDPDSKVPASPGDNPVVADEPDPDRPKSPVSVKPPPMVSDVATPAKVSENDPQSKPNTEPGQSEPARSAIRTSWSDPVSVTVFQGHSFDLCGYQGFIAEIDPGAYGGQSLKISSMDRDIPGRTMRGYRRTVKTGTWEQLWPHCRAEFKIVTSASTVRITISYQRR